MQNQQKNLLPPFQSVNSVPMLFFNFIFGLFFVFFALFFMGGMVYLVLNPFEEAGLDEVAGVILFLIFLIAIFGIVVLVIYSRKKMYTTTIIDEKGIRYSNKFNGKIIKELPWSSFAKRELTTLDFPKYVVSSNTPMKSAFDQFFWPILKDKKVVIHIDAFQGRHFFCLLYSNRTELIRVFLLGLAHYRPDITVDPSVFVKHYINPENYIVEYRKRLITQAIGFVFFIFIIVVIYYFVFH
ncbi:hypothetical protein [Flavobacterium sp. HTF]|uniref:hypothetical protein n=1 Tax=Flavobacterium sp. HTF TaxID=2170732 RepID=UPI000D5D6FBE|nr:hypothetical protein [Flavobacterium sp. HTF]PWB23671.1 hypothetical protein DCO46_13975 [Flavobacterium sp. HTF]